MPVPYCLKKMFQELFGLLRIRPEIDIWRYRMSDKDKRAGWFAKVKVGDWLYFRTYGFGAGVSRHKVVRVTPTGRVGCGNWTLDSDGYVRGEGGWGRPRLLEPTKEVLIEWKMGHLRSAITGWVSGDGLKNASLDKLAAVVNAIRGKEVDDG
jgi:hypothetical protein